MAGTWSKDEERLLLQLRSEATVNEELSGTSHTSGFHIQIFPDDYIENRIINRE